ncbi:hypothetical protein V5O48_018486 [Marasmius crinis-equi]|uniref:Uncharacterized protein n=1 Tax=Marasmius crinis-equi TaxID=585013 RepID=A0ABR3EL41_9AGAR
MLFLTKHTWTNIPSFLCSFSFHILSATALAIGVPATVTLSKPFIVAWQQDISEPALSAAQFEMIDAIGSIHNGKKMHPAAGIRSGEYTLTPKVTGQLELQVMVEYAATAMPPLVTTHTINVLAPPIISGDSYESDGLKSDVGSIVGGVVVASITVIAIVIGLIHYTRKRRRNAFPPIDTNKDIDSSIPYPATVPLKRTPVYRPNRIPPAGTMLEKVRRLASARAERLRVRQDLSQEERPLNSNAGSGPTDVNPAIQAQLDLIAQRMNRIEAELAPPDYASRQGSYTSSNGAFAHGGRSTLLGNRLQDV